MIKVEFSTKEEWLEARKSCLTGTTVGEHIGIVSPYAPKPHKKWKKVLRLFLARIVKHQF